MLRRSAYFWSHSIFMIILVINWASVIDTKPTGRAKKNTVKGRHQTTGPTRNTSLILGTEDVRYDRMIFKMWVFKINHSNKTAVSTTVSYPFRGYLNNTFITYIEVLDKSINGHGGYPTLIDGGIGHKNVSVKITSEPAYGLTYQVRIFGHTPLETDEPKMKDHRHNPQYKVEDVIIKEDD